MTEHDSGGQRTLKRLTRVDFRDTEKMYIAGIEVPGIYDVDYTASGRKKQYQTEVKAGGGGGLAGIRTPSFDEQEGSGEGDSGSGGNKDSEGGDTDANADKAPPIELTFKARLTHAQYEELDTVREKHETFSVKVADWVLNDMELAQISVKRTGERPYSYAGEIKVREWRKVEAKNTMAGIDTKGGGSANGGVSGKVSKWSDENGNGVVMGDEAPEMEVLDGATVALSDGGTFQNKIIEASGGVTITAEGSGWAIRNIGIRGMVGGGTPIKVKGDGIIENVYLGDGVSGGSGVFIHPDHSGTIRVRGSHFAGFDEHAVYGSAPGNGSSHPNPGGGGTYVAQDCYVTNCISGFRTGTSGSKVENCVVDVGTLRSPVNHSGNGRAHWVYYNDAEVIDSDLKGRLVVGGKAWTHQNTSTISFSNTRFTGNILNKTGNPDAVDESGLSDGADVSESNIPEGVPMTPEEAATGLYNTAPPGG